jgi:hypothetical protein
MAERSTVSTPPSQPAGPLTGMPPVSSGRVLPDGRRVYQLAGPKALWWTWVVAAVLGLGDVVVQGRHGLPPKLAAGALAVSGLLYACTLWPRVIADDDGVIVRNPLRSFRVPWAAIHRVSVGDSVELRCARTPPKRDKTVHSWALATPRRSRARAQLRGNLRDRGARGLLAGGHQPRPGESSRLPDEARQALRQQPAERMARELAQILDRARGGAVQEAVAGAALSASWDWQPLAAILLPALVFGLLYA